MKKNLWVLLALSALIAMFVIAGCAPKPTPTPTPTPTATPTTPPTDTAAPKVVSTTVYKYGAALCQTCTGALYADCEGGGIFNIIIEFDENIDPLVSSCVFNPASWDIKVKNSDRFIGGVITANAIAVAVDGKQIAIQAQVYETGTLAPVYDLVGKEVTMDPYLFCGLICGEADAAAYAKEVNNEKNSLLFLGLFPAPEVADSIEWTLVNCLIADELGNVNCNYSGSDCCLEATCETCTSECPFGEPACATCENPCQ